MKKLNYIYLLLLAVLSFSACDLFVTNIEEDRSSFFKIFSYTQQHILNVRPDYLVANGSDYLIFASNVISPQAEGIPTINILEINDEGTNTNTFEYNIVDTFIQVIPLDEGQNGHIILARSLGDYVIQKVGSFENSTPDYNYNLDINEVPVHAETLPNGNIILLSNLNDKISVRYFDAQLNQIWQRNYFVENAGTVDGKTILYNSDNNTFTILGVLEETGGEFLLLSINDDGNEVNVRFQSEFFSNSELPQSVTVSGDVLFEYDPVLVDVGTHYLIVDRGLYFEYGDGGENYRVYQSSKDFATVTRYDNLQLNLETLNSAQLFDDEILISGTTEGNVIIKKLSADAEIINWANGQNEVILSTNIVPDANDDNRTFVNSGNFIPLMLQKATDGGFTLLGTYSIFSNDEFEPVMALFKIREDGSY